MFHTKKAFSLVEVLLAVTLFAIFAVGIVYVSLDTLQKSSKVELENEGLLYASEGLEAIYALRAEDYWQLTSGSYGLSLTGDSWGLTTAPEIIDTFYERTVTIEDVYRDSNGDIIDSGGTLDIKMKKITSEVTWTWRGLLPRTVRLVTYLSDWPGDEWVQTTCTEWNGTGATFNSTDYTETASPPANNCALDLTSVEAPSDFFESVDIGEHGADVDVSGTGAYLASEKSAQGLSIIDVTDVTNPIILRQLDVGGKGTSVRKNGNYVYMGVESGSKGFAIINVSNPSNPTISSQLNVGSEGNRFQISGNYVYLGTENSTNSFKIINISNPASPSIIRSVDLGGKVKDVALSGNYAFVAVENSSQGIQVIDITNPATATKVGQLNVGSSANSIVISGSYAYVGTTQSTNSLKILNVANPLAPTLLGSLEVGALAQDVNIEGNYLYVALDQNDPGLAVVRLHEAPTLSIAFSMDVEGKVTAIDTNENHVFLATDISNKGLVIVGTANTDVAASGNYISQAFDLGSEDVRYNYLEWDGTVAAGGTLSLQIRTASSQALLSSATWIGPDGTAATFYEDSPTLTSLSPTRSGERWVQFRIYMTSNGINSSSVESITLNYTP